MADILGELPTRRGKWRNLLAMNQATSGRTVPESTMSAMMKGDYDSAYDAYYRGLGLSQNREASDRNYELALRNMKNQEDAYDQQNSLATKLGGGVMELGKAYTYGKAMNGQDIIPKWISDPAGRAWESGTNSLRNAFPNAANAYDNTIGVAVDTVFPKQPVGTMAANGGYSGPGAFDVGMNYEAAPQMGGFDQMTPGQFYDGMGEGALGTPETMYGGAMNASFDTPAASFTANSLSPYAASALSSMIPNSATQMSMAPTAQVASQAAQNTMMNEIGVAPTMTFASDVGANVGTQAASGAVTEGAANATANAATNSAIGVGSGLAGGIAGGVVSFGVGQILSGLGVNKHVTGALSGAAGGAVAGSVVNPGVGTIIGAVVGGVIGMIGSLFDSWICGMVDKHVGMTDHEKASMELLKNWCKENQRGWLRWYVENGVELVECIEDTEEDIVDYCAQLRIVMIEPIVAMVDNGDMEGAFKIYKTMALFQFYKYAPHIPVPEDCLMRKGERNAEASAE